MYWIYSFLYGLALLISLPYWLIGMARAGKYRAGLMGRCGAIAQRLELPRAGERSIWIHGVAVGEVLALGGLVDGRKTGFPQKRLFVSTTTLTGQTSGRRRL